MNGFGALSRFACVLGMGVVLLGCGEAAESLGAPDDVPAPTGAATVRRQREAVLVATGADLRIVEVTTPVTAVLRNGTAPVAVTLCNAGSQSAPASALDVVVSTDATLTSADLRVATDTVPALAPGACVTRTVTGAFSMSSRNYFLGAIADPLDALDEESESNNTFTGPTLYVGSRPDLTISLTSAPPLAAPGTTFTVSAIVCNIGTSSASSTRAEVRLSLDSVIDTGDVRVGLASLGSLAAGACVPVNIAASGSITSERQLGLRATTSSTEVSTANNTALGGLFAIGTGPDLIATALTGTPAGTMATAVTVCNQGNTASGPSNIELVLSADELFEAGDSSLGSILVNALAAGACVELLANQPITVPAGSWRLLGQVDPYTSVTELIEGNNFVTGPTLSLGADLAVTSMVATEAGTHFDFEATICNQGNLTAPQSSFRLRASVDQTIGAEDAVLWTQITTAIAPAQCSTLTGTFAPPPLPGGTYFLIGRADDLEFVSELDEANNLRVSPPLGLGADLVFEGVSAWMANSQIGYSVRVCNRGNVATPPNPVWVVARLSADAVMDGTDSMLSPVAAPAIAAGSCFDVGSVETPTARGSRYLLVAVDELNQIVETNEANNAGVGPQLGIDPDLALETLSASYVYPSLTLSAHACNLGTMPSQPGMVMTQLSPDTSWGYGPNVRFLYGMSVPLLAPGACTDVVSSEQVTNVVGVFNVLGSIDPAQTFPDLNPVNNGATAPQQLTFKPDLALETLTASYLYPTLTLSAHVCNLGTTPSQPTNVMAMLSVDTNWEYAAGDRGLNGPAVPFLDPGACTDVVSTEQVTNVSGVFSVIGSIDPMQTFPDLNPANNTALAALQLAFNPDLALETLSASYLYPTLTMSAHVCNLGTTPSPYTNVMAMLSVDTNWEYAPGDRGLSGMSVPYLDPGACADVVSTEQVTDVSGVFSVIGSIDPWAYSPDLNRANNTATAPLQLAFNPDLALETLSASYLYPTLTLSAHVCNLGTTPSQYTNVMAMLSVDTNWEYGPGDRGLSGMSVPYLDPGACADLVSSEQVTDVSGAFFVIGSIDPWAYSPDLNRANNTATAPLQLAFNPDLALETLSASYLYPTLTLSAHVCNLGTTPSPYGMVMPMLSVDTSWEYGPGDRGLNGLAVPYLEPGACADLVSSEQVTDVSGAFFVIGSIDPWAYSPDLNRANNTGLGPQLTFP